MEKTQRDYLLRQQMEAIKKQLGEGGDNVAAGYRERLENAGMPENVRKEVEREVDRFERTSEQNPEHGWIRTYLDWMFEIPWNVRSEDNFDLAEARRILDADHTGLDDVKQRIIEFLAVRKLRQRARPDRARRSRLGRDHHPGRPARRRQDLARRVGGARPGTQVRARLARRHPRRGRHPRPSAHLRRRTARTDRPRPQGGRHQEPGDHARRDRQGRQRLARRPVVRAARGARPRPEQHVPRPLPRGRPRPVRGSLHPHGKRLGDDPGAAARPHGADPARRLHGEREGRHRARPPAAPPGRPGRPRAGRGQRQRRRHPRGDHRPHPRGGRAQPRARARQDDPQGRHPHRHR